LENFIFQNTTKIIFGKGTQKLVGEEVRNFSNRILLHYGGGSIKKTGLYDEVIKSLKEAHIEVVELPGVKPNPRLGLVTEGIKICRNEGINFILAVGGGSVIDSSKAIALGINFNGKIWDFFTGKAKPEKAAPVGVILTIPAAGSESSNVTVITNEDGLIKKGFHSDLIRPKFAILNPEITFSLPEFQAACGACDAMAHVMERYFTHTENVDLTDRLCEATIKTVIENAPISIKKTDDYNSRAEIMWASTIAHNDILSTGRIGDWGSHKIGHEISAIYDTAHGASLAIVFPAWMKHALKDRENVFKLYQYAVRVFDVDPLFASKKDIALEGIRRLQQFLKGINLPTTLDDINISDDMFEKMAEKCVQFGPVGKFKRLFKEDVLAILRLAG